MKRCIILRGVTGSGKTTKALELLAGTDGVVHSTDKFFIQDGKYRFDAQRLTEYHERNLEMFKRSIRSGVSPVIVDNCNHRLEHFLPYIEFAKVYGYEVEVIEMPKISPETAAHRSMHCVPLFTIERMIEAWEPYKV